MRPRHSIGLLTAGLITVLGLPAPASADTPATLYVNNTDPAKCSDAGAGSQAVPFCTVSAAAGVVQAGQTVLVSGTGYGPVQLTHSGTTALPITFLADPAINPAPISSPDANPAFRLSGVHDVVIRGLEVAGGLQVSNSSAVTVDHLQAYASATNPAIRVTGTSSGVTVSRNALYDGYQGTLLSVDGGATGTLVGRNIVQVSRNAAGFSVVDAPHTTVTNNTVAYGCGPGISVTGSSSGSNLYNNIVVRHVSAAGCSVTTTPTEIVVDATSAVDTHADYNLVSPNTGGMAYSWAGTSYQDPKTFNSATAQGKSDLLVGPTGTFGPVEGSPAIDSADATAPGVLDTDFYGHPAVDDPNTPNTGTGYGYGYGYLDRGAIELQDVLSSVDLGLDQTWAPYGTVITATAAAVDNWGTGLTYSFDFGDGTVTTTASRTATHTYTAKCDCQVTVTAVNPVGTKVVSPAHAMKVTTPGPLVPVLAATPQVPHSTDPISSIRPLSVSVDASGTVSPWPVVSYTVDYGDGSGPEQLAEGGYQHTYAAPGDYAVKLAVTDSQGRTQSTTQPFHAAYAPSGFLSITPYRLFDSRQTGGSWSGGQGVAKIPIGTEGYPNNITSGSIASVVLNVTATDVTEDSHLTVWPVGQQEPATSNLNMVAGRTASNLVTVPLGLDSSLAMALNSGHASVIVDVVGYYQPNVGDKFTPLAPSRLVDTRTGNGGRLGTDDTRSIKVAGVGSVPANAAAVVVNLTSTETTDDTYLTVYPGGQARPVSSNLNPEPGRDKSNQVIVPIGPDGTINVYNHTGATQVVLDVFGYYSTDGKTLFTPVVPSRLLDTRTNPGAKPGPDSTTMVSGIPANAGAAVLNITATDTTDSSYLTVFADGTPRPGTSNLNLLPGATIPNHVTTPVSPDGKVDIYNHIGHTDVIADVFGYFTNA